ncbi:MAG: hypothetical protein ABEJ58_09725 [Halodesulfurarchaeum sp.]
MMNIDPFDSTRSGKRRSVFFALGIVTGFLSFTAATSAYVRSAGNLPIAIVLLVLGTAAILFSVTVNQGRFTWLWQTDVET